MVGTGPRHGTRLKIPVPGVLGLEKKIYLNNISSPLRGHPQSPSDGRGISKTFGKLYDEKLSRAVWEKVQHLGEQIEVCTHFTSDWN
jgi:hypothetical protein